MKSIIISSVFKTTNLAQMGMQLLQGQMEVQEQVLEYQYVRFFSILFFQID